MALVKLKVSLSAQHGSYSTGDVVDWPDSDLDNLLRANFAELVQPEAPEAAVISVPEKAVKPSARKRG